VAVVTLNRPEKLNALSAGMLSALTETFAGFKDEDDLRAVILTGAGERAFCAGTDLSILAGLTSDQARAASERGQAACQAIEQCPVPVIAALNGLVAGGGFELALACHLRIAEPHVRFSLPETKHGLLPGYGATQRLPRIIGSGLGLELIVAGSEISADEALSLGLVNRVVPTSGALAAAHELAGTIASMAPLAVRACLKAVVDGLPLELHEGLKLETELFAALFASEDAHEGANAFLEKRKPVFRGC
jgi:enoyl-CoA hydratase/carnithine racemase